MRTNTNICTSRIHCSNKFLQHSLIRLCFLPQPATVHLNLLQTHETKYWIIKLRRFSSTSKFSWQEKNWSNLRSIKNVANLHSKWKLEMHTVLHLKRIHQYETIKTKKMPPHSKSSSFPTLKINVSTLIR